MLQHLEIEVVYNCQSTNKKVAEVQRLFVCSKFKGKTFVAKLKLTT